MANFGKVKRRRISRLPPPPPAEVVPNNLQQPEHAPAPSVRPSRATGRTAQFATRVREDWLQEFKVYAVMHRMKLVHLLEKSFEAYKQANG